MIALWNKAGTLWALWRLLALGPHRAGQSGSRVGKGALESVHLVGRVCVNVNDCEL